MMCGDECDVCGCGVWMWCVEYCVMCVDGV